MYYLSKIREKNHGISPRKVRAIDNKGRKTDDSRGLLGQNRRYTIQYTIQYITHNI